MDHSGARLELEEETGKVKKASFVKAGPLARFF
jgi:hypothetical protein